MTSSSVCPGEGRDPVLKHPAWRLWAPAFAGALGLVLALLVPFPAFAAQTVQLRADVAVHDGRVTLGDLFDGAGAASSVIVATGAARAGSLVLDAARVQSLALAHGLDWGNDQGLRRVIARAAPTGPASASKGEVLAYARDIQTGEIVQPEDLVWAPAPAYGRPFDTPRDSKEVIGQAAKRPLRAGAAASRNDVSAPLVIKRDDVVAVAYEADGVKLVLQAKALGGAALGQPFDALNPASKKVIQAIATGPGEAVVGPVADRLRTAAQTDPQLFAALR